MSTGPDPATVEEQKQIIVKETQTGPEDQDPSADGFSLPLQMFRSLFIRSQASRPPAVVPALPDPDPDPDLGPR